VFGISSFSSPDSSDAVPNNVYGSAYEACMPLVLLLAALPSIINEGAAIDPTRNACAQQHHRQCH
jgi:hypothetical protein